MAKLSKIEAQAKKYNVSVEDIKSRFTNIEEAIDKSSGMVEIKLPFFLTDMGR